MSGIRDYWQEQAKADAFEAQKQAYENDADFVYKDSFVSDPVSAQVWDASNAVNSVTVGPIDWFLDVEGDHKKDTWITGKGNNVVYHKGKGLIQSLGGDDVIFMTEGSDSTTWHSIEQSAFAGSGNDKLFGGGGSQLAWGMNGQDILYLGDGDDVAEGGSGADEFIVDLQDKGADVILDFVDAGDRITILNGGNPAKEGDWYLFESSIYNGPIEFPGNLDHQSFYEIRSADGELAATFATGKHMLSDAASYALTASINEEGIQILESQLFEGNQFAEMEFI